MILIRKTVNGHSLFTQAGEATSPRHEEVQSRRNHRTLGWSWHVHKDWMPHPDLPETSLVPRPHPKIGKGAWCHLQKFLYVLFQQSSFGVEESCLSITNYYKFLTREGGRLIPRSFENGNEASILFPISSAVTLARLLLLPHKICL